MKNKLLWIITLLPTIVTCAIIPFMEDRVPMHYDVMGNIDRWGSKYENFLLPTIIILITLFWKFFLNYLRKKQVSHKDKKSISEAQQNETVIYYIAIGMAFIFNIIHYTTMYSAIIESKNNMTDMAIDINFVINIVIGIFLIIIGFFVPKIKKNSIVGVRTVWSMKNNINWTKSNRFGGISLITSGLAIIIETAFISGFKSVIVMLAIIIINSFISIIYSYKISNTDREK